MTGSRTLNRRLAKLESLAAIDHDEPVFSEEDCAIIRRIVNEWYADPDSNADCITLLEQASRTDQNDVMAARS